MSRAIPTTLRGNVKIELSYGASAFHPFNSILTGYGILNSFVPGKILCLPEKSVRLDLNQRPHVPKTRILPTELLTVKCYCFDFLADYICNFT